LQLCQRVILVGGVLAIVVHQHGTRLGGLDTAPMAFEQGNDQIGFQLRNLAADHRRIHVHPVGGGADRPGLHGFVQVADAAVVKQFGSHGRMVTWQALTTKRLTKRDGYVWG